MINWFSTYDREDEGDEEHGVDLCGNEGEKRTVYALVLEYRVYMFDETQHTAHSTQHTAHSTQHGIDFAREKERERVSITLQHHHTPPHSTTHKAWC